MPPRRLVEQILLRKLFEHGGTIKEFGAGEKIVGEIAAELRLTQNQRSAYLETIYRKQNRVKKAYLWHRLLFRAADSLAEQRMVSRPTETERLTKRREWMLTEKGYDRSLDLQNLPVSSKLFLPIKSFEVQKIAEHLKTSVAPANYDPVDEHKTVTTITRKAVLRQRGFRQAVVEAYDFTCAVCGLKLFSPDTLSWEVEAAHIVPSFSFGRDDLWNAIGLCRSHHWAFDVGWFTLMENFRIQVSSKISHLPTRYGKVGNHELIRSLMAPSMTVRLPRNRGIYPHYNSLRWHRENIFIA